jgi:hypothetical protein
MVITLIHSRKKNELRKKKNQFEFMDITCMIIEEFEIY